MALLDLAEAEGRALRLGTVRLGYALLVLAGAGVAGLAGLGFCLWGLYQYLAGPLSLKAAALVVGVAALMLAWGLLWAGHRLSR